MTSAQTKRRVHALRAQLRASPCIGEQENRSLDLDGAERANDQISVQAGSIFVHRFERHALKIAFADSSAVDDRYGGSGTSVILEGELLKPKTDRETVLVFMHPSGLNSCPCPTLARAGEHVITMALVPNDSCLVMEKVIIDLGAVVAHAKNSGYTHEVLMAGAEVLCFYQQQAELCPAEGCTTPQPEMRRSWLVASRRFCSYGSTCKQSASLPGLTPRRRSPAGGGEPPGRTAELDLYGEVVRYAHHSVAFEARFRAAQLAE